MCAKLSSSSVAVCPTGTTIRFEAQGPVPRTKPAEEMPPSSLALVAVPPAGRNVCGAISDAVSEPSATLLDVTALSANLTFVTDPALRAAAVTAPLRSLPDPTDPLWSLALVTAPLRSPDVPILVTAIAVPPSATNSAAPETASDARDAVIHCIPDPPDMR